VRTLALRALAVTAALLPGALALPPPAGAASGRVRAVASPAGVHGARSASGETGSTGASGETGPTGAGEGATGASGDSGATGTTGSSGSTGPAGSEEGFASGPGRRCRLTLNAATSSLVAGEAATFTGVLTCPLAEDAGEQTVTIDEHTAGSRGYREVGSAITEADGAFQFTTHEGLEANSAFHAVALGVRSRRAVVAVVPDVTIHGPASGTQLLPTGATAAAAAHSSRTVTFTGSVSPADTGARVVLQRERSTPGVWLRIGVGEVQADGHYEIVHTFHVPGPATIRVVAHARGLRAAASEALIYDVAPRQNPRLTIEVSTAELAYGQPLTITGTSAVAGAILTLLARTHDGGFAKVATVAAAAGGGYLFPAQTPTQSTFYRVRGAGMRSTTLLETVAQMLTTRLAASSLHAGEALRVCGQVAPARAGEVILLQRQNPDGLGFHEVGEATLGGGADYCIEHATAAAGTETYRVEAQRSGETAASVSEPFKLSVLPASASALAAGLPEAEAG